MVAERVDDYNMLRFVEQAHHGTNQLLGCFHRVLHGSGSGGDDESAAVHSREANVGK